MQTNFSKQRLADATTAEAERILRRCVHCGLCTATCPTYVILGDERDSPRGRIYAIKDMLEADAPASAEVTRHIDRCLSCFSCMTTCPSGVDYMHLVEIARNHIEKTATRSLKDRLLRRALTKVIPYPKRFAWALRAAPFGRRMAGALRRVGLHELATLAELAPTPSGGRARFRGPGTAVHDGVSTGRVILLAGCAQQTLRPQINDATIRLFARGGIDVVVAAKAGCCGALAHHIGQHDEAKAFAMRNVDAWSKEMERGNVDAILINTSGCGTTVKDYGHLLADEPEYAERASKIAALAVDVTEFLSRHEIGAPKRWTSLKVAYHAACSLQHGQRVTVEPHALLRKAGFTVVEIPEGHLCCGSAGVYNVLQPEISKTLRDRKADHIRTLRPDIVAAGNIGCIAQLASALDVPVVHTVELLDWAFGGPVPQGMEYLEKYSTRAPEPSHVAEDYIRTT